MRDAGERGLAGVAVSNQDTVVTTDRLRRISITGQRNRRGLRVHARTDIARSVHGGARRSCATVLASPSRRNHRAPSLTFVHASDTHISPASVPRTQRLRALVDSIHPDLLIITGDLVRDALRVGEAEATGYYDLFARETAAFHTPVFTVPGNHENFGIERDTSHVSATHPLYGRAMYHHYFGPGLLLVHARRRALRRTQHGRHRRPAVLRSRGQPAARVARARPRARTAGDAGRHVRPHPVLLDLRGDQRLHRRPAGADPDHGQRQDAYRHTVSNAGAVLAVLRKHTTCSRSVDTFTARSASSTRSRA